MEFADPVGAREDEIFIAAIEARAAEGAGVKIHALDRHSGGAIEHDDTLSDQAAEDFDPFSGSGHQRLGPIQCGHANYESIGRARASQICWIRPGLRREP
jgi:hypothetical protein